MRITTLVLVFLAAATQLAKAQIGGNAAYNQGSGRHRAEQNEKMKRQITKDDMPPSNTSVFVDASVLINAKADEFVAVFSVAEQAETVEACQAKMKATINAFAVELTPLGVKPEAIFVDFTAQTKTYNYKVEGNFAKEQLEGFELKKTVSIRYRDKTLIDKMIVAASKVKIYDLIKVDYVVTDTEPIQERLAEAAAAIIKSKVARQQRLLGVKLSGIPQVYAERASTYFPTQMYDSYTAAETEDMSSGIDRSRVTVQSLRKSRTFYFNPLNADGFDRVIEPVILEPVVQFTLYLKVKYNIEESR